MAQTSETLDSIRLKARLLNDKDLLDLFLKATGGWFSNIESRLYEEASIYIDELNRRKDVS